MLLKRILYFSLLIHLVKVEVQLNFHLTDWTNENHDFLHDCLNVIARTEHESDPYQVISYSGQFFTREPIFAHEDISCISHSNGLSTFVLTSSCEPYREELLIKTFFSIKPKLLDEQCWLIMQCIIQLPNFLEAKFLNFAFPKTVTCESLYNENLFKKIIKDKCPNMIPISDYPILDDHVYFLFEKNSLKYSSRPLPPTYICFDNQRIYIPDDGKTFLLTAVNKTSRYFRDINSENVPSPETRWLYLFIRSITKWLSKVTPSILNNSTLCNQTIMYQCENSMKCISKTRLLNEVNDCYYNDDEDYLSIRNNTNLIEQLPHYIKCKSSNNYIHLFQVNDQLQCDCRVPGDDYCDDEHSGELYFRKTILFQTICDKYLHLTSEFTSDKNETDETNCEHWPIVHVYNHCDGFWYLVNGEDELNCDPSESLLNCSKNHHVCVSIETKQLICLPIEKANNGIIDCFGAADESTFCNRTLIPKSDANLFYCGSYCITDVKLCNKRVNCDMNEDDEKLCQNNDLEHLINDGENGICTKNYELYASDPIKTLYRLFVHHEERFVIHFTLNSTKNSIGYTSQHGFPLQISLNKTLKLICLCPSSYYVKQYFREIPFIIIILLIDITINERIIHSYEKLNFLFLKHCQKKFNIYLLYSTRPKDSHRNYSIHIDIYEKLTLNYRGSFIKSILYSFLPIHRLVYQLHILKYNESFCQCDRGWSGKFSAIQYFSTCSLDSLSLGQLGNNRSLCMCSLDKIGSRCFISNCICQKETCFNNEKQICFCQEILNKTQNTCENNGECYQDNSLCPKYFLCQCRVCYYGKRCELNINTFSLSLDLILAFHIKLNENFIK
ncbi:hypothetical protein I4U23_010824 [Adineta vaga]|nr:hypothetical protein I4U23_010824 [Adineta vaga]